MKDNIEREADGYWITLDGEKKPLGDWMQPGISRCALRSRCRRWMEHPNRYSVREIVYLQKLETRRNGREPCTKTVYERARMKNVNSFEKVRNHVAITWRMP